MQNSPPCTQHPRAANRRRAAHRSAIHFAGLRIARRHWPQEDPDRGLPDLVADLEGRRPDGGAQPGSSGSTGARPHGVTVASSTPPYKPITGMGRPDHRPASSHSTGRRSAVITTHTRPERRLTTRCQHPAIRRPRHQHPARWCHGPGFQPAGLFGNKVRRRRQFSATRTGSSRRGRQIPGPVIGRGTDTAARVVTRRTRNPVPWPASSIELSARLPSPISSSSRRKSSGERLSSKACPVRGWIKPSCQACSLPGKDASETRVGAARLTARLHRRPGDGRYGPCAPDLVGAPGRQTTLDQVARSGFDHPVLGQGSRPPAGHLSPRCGVAADRRLDAAP